METIERDFTPKGVKFFYVYKSLAHPENFGYVTPYNLKERLMHVAEAKRTLGSRIPWICDTMDNDLKHALGDRPNSEYIVDPNGMIVVSRDWSDPSQLRRDLVSLVGQVAQPTTLADLNMKQLPPPGTAPTGVIKRLELPGQMSPLKITAIETPGTPHYAKLRAESGSGGQLYLGFFVDPLYKVHWNNKAPALQFTIEPPPGVTVRPTSGVGPKVDVDADADPREFLIDVTGRSNEPIKVIVKYFACDDAETFCVPVTQEYLVAFERDRDGGNRRIKAAQGPQQIRGGDMMLRMFTQNDRNADGQLTGEEIPAQMRRMLDRIDTNSDGAISEAEMQVMISRRGDTRPGMNRPPQN